MTITLLSLTTPAADPFLDELSSAFHAPDPGDHRRLWCFSPLLVPVAATLLLSETHATYARWTNGVVRLAMPVFPNLGVHPARLPRVALVSYALSVVCIAVSALWLFLDAWLSRRLIVERMGAYSMGKLLWTPPFAVVFGWLIYYMMASLGVDARWVDGQTIWPQLKFASLKLVQDFFSAGMIGTAPIFWLALLGRVFSGREFRGGRGRRL